MSEGEFLGPGDHLDAEMTVSEFQTHLLFLCFDTETEHLKLHIFFWYPASWKALTLRTTRRRPETSKRDLLLLILLPV